MNCSHHTTSITSAALPTLSLSLMPKPYLRFFLSLSNHLFVHRERGLDTRGAPAFTLLSERSELPDANHLHSILGEDAPHPHSSTAREVPLLLRDRLLGQVSVVLWFMVF